MKTRFLSLSILFIIPVFCSCGGGNTAEGGSEFGNPVRLVTGHVISDDSVLGLIKRAQSDCPVDTVIATDSLAQTTTAELDSDCSFELPLTVNKAYRLSFTSGGTFVALMIVYNGPNTVRSSVFIISASNSDMALGTITIAEGEADPETEPASENDQDEDGVDDFEDTDDDGDEVLDDDEEDCDLDGYDDDYDESDSSCDSGEEDDSNESSGAVLEVFPENGEEFVLLDTPVDVVFDCEIDQASVTLTSFRVESDGDSISCTFIFSDFDTVVSCDHNGQDFLPLTSYTATLDGVLCLDGMVVDQASWSWTTDASN